MNTQKMLTGVAKGLLLSYVLVVFSGCPESSSLNTEYDPGFAEGFMVDEEYWQGYDHSYLTVPEGALLYTGSEIPVIEDESYDAGYWDGVWYAYNDGYFVCYDYGFTIGFSEGYDLAFRGDWFEFLAADLHPEYLDGSFADGYNDGFSEGSVFGATDYQLGLPLDWLDAMWDYRDGTDLFIEELDRGTGTFGPVYLYEYGVDPNEYIAKTSVTQGMSRIRQKRAGAKLSPRTLYAVATTYEKAAEAESASDEISYRELTEKVRTDLSVIPTSSSRAAERDLSLSDRWLDRVNAYRQSR
ncbi:MAG: hypothetical protein KAH38_01490 [Candidatus Hydrogenedentes bacterium]|nr:hypothetical protein [Candidatus Hydrogenedentota bacterium]